MPDLTFDKVHRIYSRPFKLPGYEHDPEKIRLRGYSARDNYRTFDRPEEKPKKTISDRLFKWDEYEPIPEEPLTALGEFEDWMPRKR